MRPSSTFCVLILTSFALTACTVSGGGGKRGAQSGEGAKDAGDGTDTGTEKTACLAGFNVINGQETDQYPSVGLLAELDPDNVVGGTCSGTWVGPNTMITAAHCITAGSETELVYLAGSSVSTGETIQDAQKIVATGIKPIKVIVNADELKHGNLANDTIDMTIAYKDMAILIFKDDVAPATTKILDRLPKDAEAATIVGFGATASDVRTATAGEKSIKRVGKNKVVVRNEFSEAFPDLLLMFGRGETTDASGKATDSLSGAGDSGGPIFVDGAVAGVVSNGAADQGGDTQISELAKEAGSKGDNVTAYSSLNSTFAKALLAKAKAAGAKFELGSGSDATQPGTGAGKTATCLTDDEVEEEDDEID